MAQPKAVRSQDFKVPVAAVLKGAKDLIEIAVIGVDADGELYVASSVGTPQTLALFDRARPHIKELQED